MNEPAGIRWPPRVKKHQVRRLYENDACGITDEELIDEVGWTLYLRCRAIVDIDEARRGSVRCPACRSEGRETTIARLGGPEEQLTCPACGWHLTWRAYCRSFKRRQLNSGGALSAFRGFMERFDRARSAREKLLAIDRVIHEFHYSLRGQPDVPTRAACVNLIEGTLTEVVAFLDSLANCSPESQSTREAWRAERQRIPWGSTAAQ